MVSNKSLTKIINTKRTKMGRPKLPKNAARKILLGAKFSPPEARSVEQSARESRLDKSKWIRERLLEHVRLQELGRRGGAIEYLPEAAALDAAGRVIASGSAVLYHASGTGEFFLEKNAQTGPAQSPAFLRDSSGHQYKLTRVEGLCDGRNKPPHMHLEFAPLQSTSQD
jgi:hypothetical protein